MRKQLRKLLEKLDYRLSRFLGYTYWLHLGDLLTPCNGMMTAGQYIVASRALDVESLLKGNAPVWQNYIADKIYGCGRSAEQYEAADRKFKMLVESLESGGLNPNIAACSISDSPVVLNNGTHRLGWCAARMPNAYLPCIRDRHDLKPWFPIDGETYFRNLLDANQMLALRTRYHRILTEDVRTDLTAFSDNRKEMGDVLREFGTVVSEREIDNHITVFRFHLDKQFLYTEERKICSKYVKQMEDRLSKGSYFRIGHTVTESIIIDSCLEEL